MFKTCKQCQKGKNITKGLICSACKMKKKRERDKVVTGSHNKVVTGSHIPYVIPTFSEEKRKQRLTDEEKQRILQEICGDFISDVKAPVNVKADVKANVKADVKASGINWHPDDYQLCTDEEELLRRIELADREHRLLLKEKR